MIRHVRFAPPVQPPRFSGRTRRGVAWIRFRQRSHQRRIELVEGRTMPDRRRFRSPQNKRDTIHEAGSRPHPRSHRPDNQCIIRLILGRGCACRERCWKQPLRVRNPCFRHGRDRWRGRPTALGGVRRLAALQPARSLLGAFEPLRRAGRRGCSTSVPSRVTMRTLSGQRKRVPEMPMVLGGME